jgi:hypothetical protein
MGKATMTTKIEAAKKGEVVKVNFVRVETTELRKYPMHLLQSQGSDAKEIVIRDTDANGKEIIRWRVLFTSPEGSPGALAYRIDRLIIDKCLEAHREVPSVLRLGTLNEICDALDIDRTGHNTKNIQTALMQLYGTEIDCDSESTVRFKRFQWICFTGKKFPKPRQERMPSTSDFLTRTRKFSAALGVVRSITTTFERFLLRRHGSTR